MNRDKGGVYVAIVKDNKLDDQGRIAIAIEGFSDQAGSYPARVMSFMAGDDRGALFLPEVGDQVLVAFVNGSPNEAVVIGSLWSSVDQPPASNADGNNDIKVLKTRSGHQIRLIDQADGERIEIVDKTGKNRILIDSKNNVVSIEAPDGDLVLRGKTISITAQNAMKIESTDATVDVKAKGNTTIKGQIVDLNP